MAVPTPKEEILAILRGINATGESLGVNNASEVSKARRTLLQEAKKLVAALEDPHAEVWPRAFQVNVGVSVSTPRPPPPCSDYPEGFLFEFGGRYHDIPSEQSIALETQKCSTPSSRLC